MASILLLKTDDGYDCIISGPNPLQGGKTYSAGGATKADALHALLSDPEAREVFNWKLNNKKDLIYLFDDDDMRVTFGGASWKGWVSGGDGCSFTGR